MIIKTVKLTEKGQIVIPKDVREACGFSEGERIMLINTGTYVQLLPEKQNTHFLPDQLC